MSKLIIVIEYVFAIMTFITVGLKVASFWMADKTEKLNDYFGAGYKGSKKAEKVVSYKLFK
jgi:hypothetical protein